MSWSPFTPGFTPLLLLFYNLVQLMLFAGAIVGFHLFIFMWMYKMYKLCTTTAPLYPALLVQNLPVVSGQTIRLALFGRTGGLIVRLAMPGENKGISVKWELVAS